MSSVPTAQAIANDARWLAQALDPASAVVRLVAMGPSSYRTASFLDDRLMQRPVDVQMVAWRAIEAAMQADLRTDARWIFHIGHVGSTLVSRLLGEINDVLAVREPRLLRDIAFAPAEVRGRFIEPVAKLMSRTFNDREIACVKATSFASEFAPLLVPAGERALFIYARPRKYVASILAGENSVRELRALEAYRTQRLASRNIRLGTMRNDADRAAAAWACEMVTLHSAAEAMVERAVEWMDFDAALADLPQELGRITAFFGFTATDDRLRQIATGPLLQRYSKDPSYEYSAGLRAQLIDQELRIQGRAVEGALAMLRATSERSPLLAHALQRAEGQ